MVRHARTVTVPRVDAVSEQEYKLRVAAVERLRFSVLGSGSGGNCVVVTCGDTTILLDAGLSARATQERMRALGLAPRAEAVFITHEHADHVQHAARVADSCAAKVWANAGTVRAATRALGNLRIQDLGTDSVSIGSLTIEPVAKPHDAAQPVSFLVHGAGETLGFFTDLGHVDAVVARAIHRCSALIMEANHDAATLAAGAYPPWLRARVGGLLGHMNNADAAAAIARHAGPQLRELVLAHLSKENNSPALVRESMLAALGAVSRFRRRLSLQDRPTPLLEAGIETPEALSA